MRYPAAMSLLGATLAATLPAAAQRGDTIVARQYAAIGQVEGAPEYLFGDIYAVAEDSQRRIHVADRIGSTIRVYAPSGEFIRQIGAEGRGPGEYEWPVDIRFRRDTAYVRDRERLTILVPRRRNPGPGPDPA